MGMVRNLAYSCGGAAGAAAGAGAVGARAGASAAGVNSGAAAVGVKLPEVARRPRAEGGWGWASWGWSSRKFM